MKIICTNDYDKMSERAAEIVLKAIAKKKCLLGLATGSTPVGMYERLTRLYREGRADFRHVQSVNLDEYISLPPSHEQSYRYFMQSHLFDHINIDPKNTHLPSGTASPEAECRRYEDLLKSLGRIDLQVLGLGHNGHIGFNEPGEIFVKETHIVDLTESTILANARFFSRPEEVPRRAITMGIRSIMQARTVLVLVSGRGKAEIVKRAFTGDVTPRVPASVLQLHPNVILIGDKEALSEL